MTPKISLGIIQNEQLLCRGNPPESLKLRSKTVRICSCCACERYRNWSATVSTSCDFTVAPLAKEGQQSNAVIRIVRHANPQGIHGYPKRVGKLRIGAHPFSEPRSPASSRQKYHLVRV